MRTAPRSLVTALAPWLVACHAPAPPPPSALPAAASTEAPAPAPPPSEPVPLGPLPADVKPTHESLALDIDPAAEQFHGTADIAIKLGKPRRVIWLHGRGLTVAGARVVTSAAQGLPATWEQVDESGVVRVTVPREVAGDVTLHVEFTAAYDPQLVGVYRVKTRAGAAVFSKFEAIYARRAFPCFDEPAFKLPWDVAITAPAAASVVGNMAITADKPVDAGRKRVTFATTPALPSYLVAFAVGPFEARATTLAPSPVRPEPLAIGAVAMRGRAEETAYALDQEPRLLAEQERYFGVAFPFPKLDLLALPDFQSGAMENAGAITFRDSLLLVDGKGASSEQKISVANVLAHETAHQWFGDLVTMKWWDDLWLNEGFATFLATRTMIAVRPEVEAELRAADSTDRVMNGDSLATARRIRQPIETPHDITNAFDGITYQKGAAVLTMLAHYVGDEAFRRGLHDFLTAHARGNATTDELVAALSAAAGRPLAPLVASFIDQPGVPVVSARLTCVAGKGAVELAQARWKPAGSTLADDTTWTIPVCVRAGIGKKVEDACTLLTGRTGTLALPGCADWLMPNAQAAGYYRATLPAADLARLRDRAAGKLATVERLALGHDLTAAFASAALPGDEVLRALEVLARDPHGAVASVPLELWDQIAQHFTDARQRAVLHAKVARLYAPTVAKLGWAPAADEAPQRRLLRTDLLGDLALRFDDPAVLGEAARRGRRLLGLDRDHKPHPDAAPADLVGIALAAAVRAGGVDVFDALVARLAQSDNAVDRQRMLVALSSTRDPALMTRALDLSLDPGLRANERVLPLVTLLSRVATRDAAWTWLTAHFDALTPLLPDRVGGAIPTRIALCDAEHAAAVRDFFTSRIEKLTGGPRNLAQALEAAQQCAARVAAQRDSVARYLK
ncbi:MAG TPA: M1 family metallopeptidase [Kofleriaceae bacterium]|nr:M1 family metallopeptidase [Kofleriaceae bacterium]